LIVLALIGVAFYFMSAPTRRSVAVAVAVPALVAGDSTVRVSM
jgi:hypothetical protein